MIATMTGKRETRDGREMLVIERRFSASLEDVWAACTEPDRMVRWIGTWTGDPATGAVTFWMTAEGEDVPAEVWDVERCEPPRALRLRSREAQPFSEDSSGPAVHWILQLDLAEEAGTTTLTVAQDVYHAELGSEMVANVGTGWDYYLDRLGAHVAGAPVEAVEWDDYEPGSAYYRDLFA